MTLKEMCELTAVHTDRRDDFVVTTIKGAEVYDPEDDPGLWFESMKSSINLAYREVARRLLMPDIRMTMELDKDGGVDLTMMRPDVITMKAVYSEDGSTLRQYDFETKYRIIVRGGKPGERVLIQYHYVPEPLEDFDDEPVFPEGLVDPMVYVSLAAANLWLMERKIDIANEWRARYYEALNNIRGDMRSPRDRRIRRAIFR